MPMDEDFRANSLDQLKWSLQALALPYEAQQSLFPSFACTADELALDFDHWCETATKQHEFAADQLAALAAVATLLTEMSGEKNSSLWMDDALAQLPRWQELRVRARDALQTFQWNLETPPSDRAIFIGPKPGT